MPGPIPGLKVEVDKQKVEFLRIFGRRKTGFFRQISGCSGGAPLATNHAVFGSLLGSPGGLLGSPGVSWGPLGSPGVP